MKLILLQHLSGDKVYAPGEEIELKEAEALRFITKGIAKAKSVKAHNDLMAKAEKIEKEEAGKRAKLVAIQKEKELKGEADALLDELVAVVATVETINPKFGAEILEHFAAKLSKGK